MIKILLIIFILLFTSCSVTLVYAPKCVHCSGDGNSIEIKGSDLEGNSASQSADGKLTIPFRP